MYYTVNRSQDRIFLRRRKHHGVKAGQVEMAKRKKECEERGQRESRLQDAWYSL